MSHTFFKSSLSFKITALLALGLVFSSPQTWGAGGASPQTSQKPVLTTLHRFDGTHGANPQSTLTLGTDGNFYGVTPAGGLNNWGTVFKLTPEGKLTTLWRFDSIKGREPAGPLVQGADGAFYGTTLYGGSIHDAGTVFRITPSGKLTILHSFRFTDGFFPECTLLPAPDGSFYGTTYNGGADNNYGVVFHLTAQGSLLILHTFQKNDGANPQGTLVLGADGTLYGTTYYGGKHLDGTVYQITPDGVYHVLHDFTDTDGRYPTGGLTLGADGMLYGTLYGTIYRPGVHDDGGVFRITKSGVFTLLHKFSDDGHGTQPYSALTLGKDGNFYGTAAAGGTDNQGTVFQMTPAGQVTTLYKFHTDFDGRFSFGGIAFGPDGALYGTPTFGGTKGYGTIYKLTLP